MNIVFWAVIILAAVGIWVTAVASMFSAKVGKVAKETIDSVKESISVEDKI